MPERGSLGGDRRGRAYEHGEGSWQSILELAPHVMMVAEVDETIRQANGATLATFGYSEEELLELPITELIHPSHRDALELAIQSLALGARFSAESLAVRKDGSTLAVEVRLARFKQDVPALVLLTLVDITERSERRRDRDVFTHLDEDIAHSAVMSVVGHWLELVQERTGVTRASVAIFDSDGKHFRLVGVGTSLEDLVSTERVATATTIYPEMMHSHEPRYRADIAAERTGYPVDTMLLRGGIVSSYNLPLIVADRCVGMLNAGVEEVNGISTETRSFLRRIAPRISQVVHTVWLHETLQKRERELRAALDDKDVLLREVHHRVKNNLQVISSMLSLQGRYVHDPDAREMFEECRARVRSMALVHAQLDRSTTKGQIDLGQYVRQLVTDSRRTHTVAGRAITWRIQADESKVCVDAAVTLGLILNELVLNAMKHAFASNQDGTIDIACRWADDTGITLVVRDDGVGLPEGFDPDTSDTLGMLLTRSLTQQLGGTVQFRTDGGTEVTICVPPGSLEVEDSDER